MCLMCPQRLNSSWSICGVTCSEKPPTNTASALSSSVSVYSGLVLVPKSVLGSGGVVCVCECRCESESESERVRERERDV